MITIEPNAQVKAVHDGIQARLSDDRIVPCLEADLVGLGPSEVALDYEEVGEFPQAEEIHSKSG